MLGHLGRRTAGPLARRTLGRLGLDTPVRLARYSKPRQAHDMRVPRARHMQIRPDLRSMVHRDQHTPCSCTCCSQTPRHPEAWQDDLRTHTSQPSQVRGVVVQLLSE